MSVDQIENKNSRKGLAQVGYCLKYLMNFLRPYKGGLILGLLMVVVANITFAVMPVVEGEMTTQLFSDGEAILKGVEGAHVHFDVIFGIMGTLVIIYIIKTVSQLITAVFLTRVLQHLFRRNLPRLKGLDQVSAQVRSLVDGMAAVPLFRSRQLPLPGLPQRRGDRRP